MTHAPAFRGCLPCWRADAGLPSNGLRPAQRQGVAEVLRDHRKRQAEERPRVGPEWRGTDDYVFPTAWGERSTPTRCRPS